MTDDLVSPAEVLTQAMVLLAELDEFKAVSPGGRPADDSPIGTPGGRQNWVDKSGGLPRYIRMIAHALIRKGMSEEHAIATAVTRVKVLAATSKDPKVKAAAAEAVAHWEAMKGAKSDDEFLLEIKSQAFELLHPRVGPDPSRNDGWFRTTKGPLKLLERFLRQHPHVRATEDGDRVRIDHIGLWRDGAYGDQGRIATLERLTRIADTHRIDLVVPVGHESGLLPGTLANEGFSTEGNLWVRPHSRHAPIKDSAQLLTNADRLADHWQVGDHVLMQPPPSITSDPYMHLVGLHRDGDNVVFQFRDSRGSLFQRTVPANTSVTLHTASRELSSAIRSNGEPHRQDVTDSWSERAVAQVAERARQERDREFQAERARIQAEREANAERRVQASRTGGSARKKSAGDLIDTWAGGSRNYDDEEPDYDALNEDHYDEDGNVVSDWMGRREEDRYTRMLDELGAVIDGTYAGITVKSYAAEAQGDGVRVKADLFAPDGHKIGEVKRLFARDYDGELYAYHELLEITDRNYRGQGFATEFNGMLEEYYRESGITHIKVHADIDVGGYTWARQGYDFTDDRVPADITHRISEWLSRYGSGSTDPHSVIDLVEGADGRWRLQNNRTGEWVEGYHYTYDTERDADYGRDEYIDTYYSSDHGVLHLESDGTPVGDVRSILAQIQRDSSSVSAYDISQVGRREGDTTWPGKQILLGSDWYGVKWLS